MASWLSLYYSGENNSSALWSTSDAYCDDVQQEKIAGEWKSCWCVKACLVSHYIIIMTISPLCTLFRPQTNIVQVMYRTGIEAV